MRIIKITFLLILITGLFASCSKSSDSLATSIPAEAQSVTHINLESLIQKSNYNIFENATVERGINMGKAMLKDQSAVKLIEDFEKDPNAFGITLNKDIYFFTKGSYIGILLPVNNAKKIEESITKFGIESSNIKEEKGIFSYSESEAFNVSWNSSKLIVLIQQPMVATIDSTQLSANELLSLSKDKSILSDNNFTDFQKERQDISLYVSSNWYADLANKMELLMGTNKTDVPQETIDAMRNLTNEFKGISLGYFINFDKGKIAGHGSYFFSTPEAKAKITDMVKETTGNISEKYLQCIAEEPLISLIGNIKGTGYYSFASKMGFAKTFEDEIKKAEPNIDIKALVESFNGNVVLTLNELNIASSKPMSDLDAQLAMSDNKPKTTFKLAFLAQLSKENKIGAFIDTLIAKMPSDKIEKIGNQNYKLNNKDQVAYFGVTDNTFYFTTDLSTIDALKKSGANKFTDKTKGKNVYIYGNLTPLKKPLLTLYTQAAGNQGAQFKPLIEEGLSIVKSVEAYTQQDLNNGYSVNFTNENDNSLATLCKYLDKVLTAVGATQGL